MIMTQREPVSDVRNGLENKRNHEREPTGSEFGTQLLSLSGTLWFSERWEPGKRVLYTILDIEIVSTRVSERRYAKECNELDFRTGT